jgi:hypothetical protein
LYFSFIHFPLGYITFVIIESKSSENWARWLKPTIPATWVMEIRRIMVLGQASQIGLIETTSQSISRKW